MKISNLRSKCNIAIQALQHDYEVVWSTDIPKAFAEAYTHLLVSEFYFSFFA